MKRHSIPAAGCCKPGCRELGRDDTVLTICSTCAAYFLESSRAQRVVSVWELIDGDGSFPFAGLRGREDPVQDCWRSRDNRARRRAVRVLPGKMNLTAAEQAERFEKTRFCGVTQPPSPNNVKLAPHRFGEEGAEVFQESAPEDRDGRCVCIAGG